MTTQQPGIPVLPDGPPPFLSRYDWTPDALGEAVTFHRTDLPAIVRAEAFDITVSADDIEAAYTELRRLHLGADTGGNL